MAQDALLITGASGHLGRGVVRALSELRGGMTGLILATRHPAALAEEFPDADIRYADFAAPDTLADAFAGADRMLLISTDAIGSRAADQARAIDAARDAGMQFIAYTSMLSPGVENPAIIAPSHRATEEHLRGSGVASVAVRAGFYADFQVFEAADAIRSGRIVHNRGAGRSAYLTRADVARAAATVLAGEGGGAVTGIVELTGTRAYDATALAALYGGLGGVDIEVTEVDDGTLFASIAGSADGHNQYGAQLTVSIGQAIRGGFLDVVTEDVRRITGTPPEDLADVVARGLGAARMS